MTANKYVYPLKELFYQKRNDKNARQMKKYMKEHFEFFGIKSPQRKEITKEFFKKYDLPETGQVPEILKYLWQLPQREFQYFGINLLEKDIKREISESRINLYKYLIEHKSWWDSVDGLSTIVGMFFKKNPDITEKYMNEWNQSENMWLNRVSIIYQLKYKSEINTKLLSRYILRHALSKEFFHRKAIGWALREYSKTEPEFVIKFVDTHNLSTLSKNEALKVINRTKNN
ncbi:MAG: DNA alkylation repair protein [Bacteroidota bacterium]